MNDQNKIEELNRLHDKINKQFKAGLLEKEDFKVKINNVVDELSKLGITLSYVDQG